MHRCLMIPEICLQICEILPRNTLAAMARSCRAFEEPALSILWRRQDSLRPIMGCLPADLWQERYFSATILRATAPSDWHRFLLYAKRVRRLSFYAHGVVAGWQKIVSQCPGGNLFPNLRALSFQYNRVTGPWFKILVAPTLQELTLYLSTNWDEIMNVYDLPQTCPAIRDLTIHRDIAARDVDLPAYSDLIGSWKNLERVYADGCNTRTLTQLSFMCSLSDLHISRPPTLSPSSKFTFPTLRTLRLGEYDLHSCIEFIRSINATSLSTLEIASDDRTESQWDLLFHVISERLRDAPLSRFDFFDCHSIEHTADIFRHLYVFSDVRSFIFEADPSFSLDDRWIKEIAAAWPNLTTFTLGAFFSSCGVRLTVTLGGLVYLARKCQNLSVLHLQIDATLTGPLLECGARPNVRMESISLGWSPIEDVAEVAMVLARALPNLRHIKIDDGAFSDEPEEYTVYANRWLEVEALVCQIRNEEARASHSVQV